MTAVLNWIKSNLIIVGLCALMLVCLPTFTLVGEGMNRSVRKAIGDRVASQTRELAQVEKTSIEIRPLTPGAAPFTATRTINEAILEDYRAVREAIKGDAESIIYKALEINRRDDRLVPELLPAPPVDLAEDLPYRIYDAYVKAHEDLLKSIEAGPAVTAISMSQQLTEFDRTYRRTELNRETREMLTPVEAQKLREKMTERRLAIYAQNAADQSVYGDLSVFGLDAWKPESGKPSPVQMYDWQHTYWVRSDVIRAIGLANAAEGGRRARIAGDPSSVVKQIVRIRVVPLVGGLGRGMTRSEGTSRGGGGGPEGGSFEGGGPEGGSFEGPPPGRGFEGGGPEGGGPEGGSPEGVGVGEREAPPTGKFGKGGGGGASSGPAPPPANDDPTQPFAPNYLNSISGRTSCALYDVRNADVSLVVDSRRIPAILNAINRTNFMTVVGCRVRSIPMIESLQSGFYFGDDPVVQLDLTIETVWLRDWTTTVMPDDVKRLLGIKTEKGDQ